METDFTVLFTTLGCKVNQYDSGELMDQFRARGFGLYEGDGKRSDPDVIIVNTCIVSAEGERKSRQAIRRMRAKHPNSLLAVIGCYPQRYPELASAIDGVEYIAGTSGQEALVEKIAMRLACGGDARKTQKFKERAAFPQHHGRTRANIKIQDGCNNFCSYCIVPYTRGRARSLDPSDILNQVDTAISRGAPEIVLTGINISSYSHIKNGAIDTHSNIETCTALCDNIDLGALIGAISNHIGSSEQPVRLRLSSLEPTVITPGFVKQLSENRSTLCPHFHVSLQSGCESVLRRMNRNYTPEIYAESIASLRSVFPDAGITTDIIVGFPGEREDDFLETFDFCKRIAFSRIHVFPYSKRPGTHAAELPNHIPPVDKRDRAKRLIGLSGELSLAFHRTYIGKEVPVLIENINGSYIDGITGNYVKVHAEAGLIDGLRRSAYASVRITETTASCMYGTII